MEQEQQKQEQNMKVTAPLYSVGGVQKNNGVLYAALPQPIACWAHRWGGDKLKKIKKL